MKRASVSRPAAASERPGPPRTRAKTGCRTCRIRRVKCDEAKPACQKCVSTGRVCDGYGIWGGGGNAYGSAERQFRGRNQHPPAAPLMRNHLPTSPTVSQDEQMAFDYFRKITSMKLPGLFESGFWDVLVFQASLKEPAVLHAIIALGAAHRSGGCHEFLGMKNERDSCTWLALRQYNKSIAIIRGYGRTQDKYTLHVVLITCMIFICIELLRGEFNIARAHLQNGLMLLHETQIRSGLAVEASKLISSDWNYMLPSNSKSVDDLLIETFTRLNIQSSFLSQGTEYHLNYPYETFRKWPEDEIPRVFPNLDNARQHLDRLMNIAQSLRTDLSGSSLSRLTQRQEQLQISLSQWILSYESSYPSLILQNGRRSKIGMLLLHLYHTMITIMASTCLRANDEMVFDCYTSSFLSILSQSKEIWHLTKHITDKPPSGCDMIPHLGFTVDMGSIPPLYYVAIKCRIPEIRRQAIAQLLTSHHREGVWDGDLAAIVARHVLEMEERSSKELSKTIPKSQGSVFPDSIPRVPSAARINDVTVLLPDSIREKATISCRRYKGFLLGEEVWESLSSTFSLKFGCVAFMNCTI